MSISVSGLGSGLNYESWISALVAVKQASIDTQSNKVTSIGKQESALSGIKSDYSKLLSAIQTLTKASTSSTNVFAQKTATSSSEAVSASATSSAISQYVNVTVSQLATATVAQSTSSVASKLKATNTLGQAAGGVIKPGTMSIYVNNQKYTITVKNEDTMSSILSNITSTTGLNATLDENTGKVTIGSGSSANISIGSNADTSTLASGLSLVKNSDGTYSSSKSVYATSTSSALTSTAFSSGSVTAGTFTIGNAQFTIDGSTTLKSLINKINSTSDAGVTASWDANAGKLVLQSTDEGAININVQAGTSNFTDIMGLTTSTWSESGKTATTSVLTTGSQSLGENAKLTINGTSITSTSNTVSSSTSGIAGLTLTLNSTTSSPAKVTVSQDTSKLESAIDSFVSAFNSVIADTDTATSTDGKLYGESVLTSIRNKVRTLATGSVTGSDGYKTLSSIGITSGAIGTSPSTSTSKLVIDSDTLESALKEDPDAVMKLLIGDTSSNTKGVLSNMETVVSNSLNTKNGYFTTRETSYEKQATRIEDKISDMESDLSAYKSQLETKFSLMDKIISNLQSQASVFDSYFNKSSSKS